MPLSCPKCNSDLPDWVDAEADEKELVDTCWDLDICPYVACDDVKCLALKEPSTLHEWKDSAEHWHAHRYLHGCSHGN